VTGTYVLGDWGTTRLRLFRMTDGAVAERLEGLGIGDLQASPVRVLMDRLAIWQADGPVGDVTLCGMAGAKGGLMEAIYVDCPAGIADWRGHQTCALIDNIRIAVMPGLRHWDEAMVPDVMRGEETQIFGALALDPDLMTGEHRFVLPGTHSKWVDVRDGRTQNFRTVPTGELYALLIGQSTLIGRGTGGKGDFDQGFARGLSRAGEPMLTALFEARAGRLLDERSQDWAKGYLSGLLIGGEIVTNVKRNAEVVLIGDPALCALYVRALDAVGCGYRTIDGDAAVLAGLQLARGQAG
jgi:2-dehydro-3-deoxygalactonokinase